MWLPPSCRPATPSDVVQIVADALANSTGLIVRGGGSKRMAWQLAGTPLELDLRGLTGITDYDPDELVITALAGTPLSEIEATLSERQQMLAFEPFDHGPFFGADTGRATLGGVVAANVSGSRRVSAGAARDHVLGFDAVSGRGEAFKGGGRVVKNVTGYDLPKLMAGSRGTLAVLTSVTMRVLPRPRIQKTLLLKGLSDETANRAMTLAMSQSAMVSAAAHLPADDGTTALRVEGFGPSVNARCQALSRDLQVFCPAQMIEGDESMAFWSDVRTLKMLPVEGHDLWRISVPPAIGWQVGAKIGGTGARCVYDWGGGLVWISQPSAENASTDAIVQEAARTLGGHASLIRGFDRAGKPNSQPESSDRQQLGQLRARVKAAFDPRGILNPGLAITVDS